MKHITCIEDLRQRHMRRVPKAFFDYADRWMDEPGTQTISDSQCVQDISSDTGYDYGSAWEDQGQVGGYLQGEFPQYTFVDDMWSTYRSKY